MDGRTMSNVHPYNVTAEIPQGLYMKHAGWDEENIDHGVGVFSSHGYRKGETIGSAPAHITPCLEQPSFAETPAGKRVVTCDIHFFDLPDCPTGKTLDSDAYAIFASWMSFLNYPSDGQAQSPANVEWGPTGCSGDLTQWHLRASTDIAPHEELRLDYGRDEEGGWMRMMRRMGKSVTVEFSAGYHKFCMEQKPKIMEQFPNIDSAQISLKCMAKWDRLSETEKFEYDKKAAQGGAR